MPFTDELMTCVVCGVQHRSNSNVQSDWRAIDIENDTIYVCPDEFPPDQAGTEAFRKAYGLVIACGLHELVIRQGKDGDPRIKLYRSQRQQARTREKPRGFSRN